MNTILLPDGTRFDPNNEEMTMPEKVQPPAEPNPYAAKGGPAPTGNGESIPRTIATVANELTDVGTKILDAEAIIDKYRADHKRLTEELWSLMGRKPRSKKGTP